MSNKLSHIYPVVIIVLLYFLFNDNSKPEVIKEITLTDTIYITKIDTLKIRDTVYRSKKIVDTMYVPNPNKDTVIILPIEQKYYGKDNLYDLWISGVNPKLDSINIYNKTNTVYVNTVTEREVLYKKCEFYLGAGFNSFKDTFYPEVVLHFKTKNKWLISAKMGYNKGLTYGMSLAVKIK